MGADSTIARSRRQMPKPLVLLAEDELFVVVDKPAGLLSVGDAQRGEPGVAERLREQGIAAAAVHRLDRDVSGALLCARDDAAREALEQQFRERSVRKTYWALVAGVPKPAAGEWKYPILEERGQARVSARGKPAVTRYRTLRALRCASELEIELVTGRYNQIRVHCAHAGWPLAGERKYALGKRDPLKAPRLALHSWRLSFAHPRTRAAVDVEAPLPPELVELLRRAGGG
jgi:23S rRNA pseudouridine1911/1915/1917 synthase